MTTAQLHLPADTESRDEPSASAEAAPRCAVCSHQRADHDPIGLRYCQATQAQALPRNCICRAQ
jgi:hypothetical protein